MNDCFRILGKHLNCCLVLRLREYEKMNLRVSAKLQCLRMGLCWEFRTAMVMQMSANHVMDTRVMQFNTRRFTQPFHRWQIQSVELKCSFSLFLLHVRCSFCFGCGFRIIHTQFNPVHSTRCPCWAQQMQTRTFRRVNSGHSHIPIACLFCLVYSIIL